ncbi:hypothetical protein [Sphaerochaeta sp.]|uniref:hypothetical protein n=1 Tax=Sphaerochaeta sp. TaxID=1972642 RepID=UPI003D133681
MKRNLSFLIITLLFFACYGIPYIAYAENQSSGDTSTDYALSCDSYASCVELGLKERKAGKESVLLYFSESAKNVRYNIYENISIRLYTNTCPPLIDVYKRVNNVNYLMDVFVGNQVNGCVKYFANVTGDNKKRDTIVGQLEITYCNEDELFNTCRQGIIYSRVNTFNSVKEKEQPDQTAPVQMQNAPQNNLYPQFNSDAMNYGEKNQVQPQQ